MAVTLTLLALALLAWPALPGRGAGAVLPGHGAGAVLPGHGGGAVLPGRPPRSSHHPGPAARRGGRARDLVRHWTVRPAGAASRARWMLPAAVGAAAALLVSWPCGVAAALAIATARHLLGRARREHRDRHDRDAIAAALRTLARDLHAGAAPADAVAVAARSGSPAVAATLSVLPAGGTPVAPDGPPPAGLHGVRNRLLAGWELSARQGIPLASVVTAIADDLADRSVAEQARAAQVAGPAVSGYVLAALPVAGLLLGAGMGTDPLGVLFGSGIGGVLLVAGTLLCCGGLLWADRIVRR